MSVEASKYNTYVVLSPPQDAVTVVKYTLYAVLMTAAGAISSKFRPVITT